VNVELDPIPSTVLDGLHDTNSAVAKAVEEGLDWLEADPIDVRAKRRQFTNGMRAMSRIVRGEEWIILWEEDPPGTAVVRFIGQSHTL
jgi:hypothetical protein